MSPRQRQIEQDIREDRTRLASVATDIAPNFDVAEMLMDLWRGMDALETAASIMARDEFRQAFKVCMPNLRPLCTLAKIVHEEMESAIAQQARDDYRISRRSAA